MGVASNYCEEIGILYSIDDKGHDKTFKVDEARTNAKEEILGPEGEEGGLLGDDEVQLDQHSGVQEESGLNIHHGIFPIIEVSSGKK